jgi:hypothetical protein
MADAVVSRETCEAKHGELLRALGAIKEQLEDVFEILKGNGKPGLRQTQQELTAQIARCDRLHEEITKREKENKEREKENAVRRDSWVMFLLRPFWPYVPPALLVGAWWIINRGV